MSKITEEGEVPANAAMHGNVAGLDNNPPVKLNSTKKRPKVLKRLRDIVGGANARQNRCSV